MKSILFTTLFGSAAAAKVATLTANNWKNEVTDSGKGTFVMFMAPWCGHCKALKPDWEKLAKKNKNNEAVTIGMVDCTQEEQLCGQNGVKGYPTIKYWKAGKTSSIDYQQGRDLGALSTFVENTFKASCDAKTKKGCNKQEISFIEKNADKSKADLEAILKEKQVALKEKKDEKKARDKVRREEDKVHKKAETALRKAEGILKNMIKGAGGKSEL